MAFTLDSQHFVSKTCRDLAGMGSEIRKMFMLGQQFRADHPELPLFDLSLGNPDLEPPKEVLEAIETVAKDRVPGLHRYMDNSGLSEVRKFVALQLCKEMKDESCLAPEQVFLTAGAAGALHIIMRTLLDPGDEVLVFAPYFSEYAPYSFNFGANLRVCSTNGAHLPTIDSLSSSLTEKTKIVLINSPNNPSGVSWDQQTYDLLWQCLRNMREKTGRAVHVVSDEPYAKLQFSDTGIASVLKQYDASWLVRSHSKDLGLAGDRIGYFAWTRALHSPDLLGSLKNSARALGQVNASAFFQRLLPLVAEARVNVKEYQDRVNLFLKAFRKCNIPCAEPSGGFFLFPQSPQSDESVFVQELLKRGVLVVAGRGFGKNGYVRLSLTRPQEELREACRIFCEVHMSLRSSGG